MDVLDQKKSINGSSASLRREKLSVSDRQKIKEINKQKYENERSDTLLSGCIIRSRQREKWANGTSILLLHSPFKYTLRQK